MGSQDLTHEEKIKRFLYTCSYFGAYITGNSDKHLCKYTSSSLFEWIKSSPEEFLAVLTAANDDPLLTKRASIFYVIGEILHSIVFSEEIKTDLKKSLFKFIKNDGEFFDFIKYYTLVGPRRKQKITTTLRKIITKFYEEKEPLEFAKTVTKQESYHGWTHKDLFKLCHYKCENIACEPVLKYVLFGTKQLPESVDGDTTIVDYIKKTHELRTSEDTNRTVALMKELHANVAQVNSKLNKNEQVWLAALSEMTTRQILQCLYSFYKFGFFKQGSEFQSKVIEAITDSERIKQCNLHPVEVFIYLKFFEKGGKPMDPKLIEYLQQQDVKADTLKKLLTPSEPKCKPVLQNINKCLKMSYDNCEPIGKRFFVTIDTTQKADETCFHSKRITFYEAAITFVRFLTKVEKNVSIAVFKDQGINFVDISKSHTAIEKLTEHKATYINPSAPIEWARNKKKQVDIFIHFMSPTWTSNVPAEIRETLEKLPEALSKYSKKMKAPNTRVVKMFLGGPSAAYTENSKNILSIAGFSAEVPRVLEAFCRGSFC